MLDTQDTEENATILPSPPSAVITLRDVRDRLAQLAADGDQQAKMQISAINTVARASGCAPDDLPVDPARLRQHLEKISPAMAGLTTGSWCSVRSRVLKALQRAEVNVMVGRRTKPLSPEWAALYQALFQNGRQASLGRFIGWLSDHVVSPHEVSDALVQRFAHELNTFSLRGKPNGIVRGAVRSWNGAVNTVPEWPQQRLTMPEVKSDAYVLPAQNFSSEFRKSLADYIAFLADPPEDDHAPLQGLRPTTLERTEFNLRQMASVVVHRGAPIKSLGSIADLATQENVDRICDFFIERLGRPNCAQLYSLLRLLRTIALHQLKDDRLAQWIGRRILRLNGGRGRRVQMTEKNRRKLAVFQDPQLVRKLLLLPFRLLKQAEFGALPPAKAALLVREAVAIELEIMCPIRLQNLSEIDVDTDFVRSHAGKNAAVHLFVPGKRTKNGEDIELEVPKQTMALIDLYLGKYRNELIKPEFRGRKPRFLFPKPNGMAKDGKVLASGICQLLQRELGLKFNIHLFRHLGCFLYLRSHPGQIDVMRRVLGHRDPTTTMRFYAHVEQSDAFRLFDTHILQLREEALRPARKKAGGKGGKR